MASLIAAAGCGRSETDSAGAAQPSHDEGATRPGPSLREIMTALGADMGAVAAAVWAEDRPGIAAAARRVAGHPELTAEQHAAIEGALGAEFGGFVGFDEAVHQAATELAARADSGHSAAALLGTYFRIQQGCVGCHASYRIRVSAALADSIATTSRR